MSDKIELLTKWNVISLGGGVQSSAMALMASCGELGPMPDCAVFADTQDEPASVYRWLDWLEPKLAFPLFRVTAGSLSESSLKIKETADGRVRWMLDRGYPEPPKSACVYCPFHHDREWRRLKNDEPEAFAKAVKFEKDTQEAKAIPGSNFRSTPFLHSSRKPLDEVDFRNDIDHGQQLLSFMDECEGMCGV